MEKDDVAMKVRKLRKSLGLNQNQFADRLGIDDQSTISKWETGKQKPSGERLARIAEMYGETVSEFVGSDLRPVEEVRSRAYRVIGEVQAGAWREAIEFPPDDQYLVSVPIPPDEDDGMPLTGYVVRGTSMNKVYPEGTTVFIASTIANGLRPRNGHKVLVSRRDKNGLYEATIKEYVVNPDGSMWLWPRSYDPAHQAPIQYHDNGKSIEEVTITGIVRRAVINEPL